MAESVNFDRNSVENILRSAKEHFLQSGYEKASLRKICSGAGVTTGALYFSFKNKAALFDALVRPTLTQLDKVLSHLEEVILEQNGRDFDEDEFNTFMFSFLIEHRDGIRLLMSRAEGSQYEYFYSKIRNHIEVLMLHYAKSVGGVEMDRELVSIVTNMFVAALSDFISRDYSKEQMISLAASLRTLMEMGFYAMLEQEKAKG